MDRTCIDCGAVFKYPSHLKRHQNRVTPCAKDLPMCGGCGKEFTTQKSLWRHKDQYCGPAKEEKQVIDAHNSLNVIVNGDSNNFDIKVGDENITNVFHINLFSQEDTSHITPERLKEMFDMTGGSVSSLISMLMQEIYQHPNNRNAYMKDGTKDDMAMVLKKDHENKPVWRECPSDVIHPSMVDKATTVFFKERHPVYGIDGMTTPLKERLDQMALDLVDLCPDAIGPTVALLKGTKKMNRSILIGNRESLRQEGLI